MRSWLAFVVGISVCVVASGQAPRVLEPDTLPNDTRLGELKTLNDHFPFVVPDNAGAWYARADALRRRVLVANGLWPMPEKTPLNAVIHGKIERRRIHGGEGLLRKPSRSLCQRVIVSAEQSVGNSLARRAFAARPWWANAASQRR